MLKPPTTLETPRLRLRPPTLDDAEAIFQKYAQDTEVTKYLIWQPHKSVDDTKAFMQYCILCWAEKSVFPWIIQRKGDGAIVGMIELRIDESKADLGYVIAREYWGKGYASEATKAVVDWAISQDEIYRVWATCDVENIASARVLEKAGMQREGVLRRWLVHPNVNDEPRDSYCYARVN